MFHLTAKNMVSRHDSSECPSNKAPRKDWVLDKKRPTIDIHVSLDSRRCEFIKPDGSRCKRVTKKQLPMCWYHSQVTYHVVIKPTKFGLGLFACSAGQGEQVFKRGDKIALYARHKSRGQPSIGFDKNGRRYTDAAIQKRYGCVGAPYAIDVEPSGNVDTISERSIGSYANGVTSARLANAEAEMVKGDVWLIAIRSINNGEEIKWHYGDEYVYNNPKVLDVKMWHTKRPEKDQKCPTM